jgi:thiamine pyrophosphate-dependent acetolactate synthase large subunit-like protein
MALNVNQPLRREQAKVMNRLDLTKRMLKLIPDTDAVVGGIGWTNFDLWTADKTRARNFYMLGSMGLAVPIGMGVALARPDLHVFSLEGDGSILMFLGSLASVAARKQKNLTIVIMDNGTYQITGGQTALSDEGADIVAIAQGAGLTQAAWAADESAFEEMIAQSRREPGPWLIGCRIDKEKPKETTERDPPILRDRFMRALGSKY